MPISNERVGGAHFQVRAHPIIEAPNTGDSDRDLIELTTTITRFIEERVREKRLAKVSTGIPLRTLLKISCFVLGANGPVAAGNNA